MNFSLSVETSACKDTECPRSEQVYLFLTVGAEGEQSHGTIGCTAARTGWHTVFGGLAASFTTQGG